MWNLECVKSTFMQCVCDALTNFDRKSVKSRNMASLDGRVERMNELEERCWGASINSSLKCNEHSHTCAHTPNSIDLHIQNPKIGSETGLRLFYFFDSLICGKENLLEFEYFANFSFGLINEIIFSVLNWQDSMITNEKKTTVQLLIVITEQHALFSGLLTLSVINAERYGSSFWDVFRFQCKKNAHLQTKSFSHAFGV